MTSLAQSAYFDSEFGMPTELSSAGTALENPYVYDASAREIKAMAANGLVEILSERHVAADGGEDLIRSLRYRRLR